MNTGPLVSSVVGPVVGISGGGTESGGSNDPDIVWDSTTINAIYIDSSAVNCNLYFYEGANGKLEEPFHSSAGYYTTGNTWTVADVIHDDATPFSTDDFIVKFEVVSVTSGHGIVQLNYQTGREDQWWELFRCDIRVDDDDNDGTAQEVVVDVTVGRWDGVTGDPSLGTAAPVSGSESTKRVTFYASYE